MAVPSCYANPSPTFQRAMRLISAISQAQNAEITTTFTHAYATGDIVRIVVPSQSGMTQINQQVAQITVTGSTTFTIPIDTTSFDAFVSLPDPTPLARFCAHVVPVGEINANLGGATQNVL